MCCYLDFLKFIIMNKTILITLAVLNFVYFKSSAQTATPDSSSSKNLYSPNREVSVTDQQGKKVFHLGAGPKQGVAWLSEVNFSTGTIEFDVKGKDVLQQSFVGIAFHGVDDSTYEGVYLRPFNFQAKDTVRNKHAIQYISLPKYDWSYLRETYPDKYEHAMLTTIDPNDWVHIKIIVQQKSIQAFINSDKEASLSVEPLTHTISGKVGFWVGNGSDGDFANLSIKNE